MTRHIVLLLAALLAAASASAQPRKLKLPAADDPAADHQVLADGFAPFDQAAQDGWQPISPEPIYLSTPQDKPTGAPLTLQPGAYRIVVLCDCNMMDVTLLRPDNQPIPPERFDNRRAMYSLDVQVAGAYLAGIDMEDCPKTECAIGVKVYRRTEG